MDNIFITLTSALAPLTPPSPQPPPPPATPSPTHTHEGDTGPLYWPIRDGSVRFVPPFLSFRYTLQVYELMYTIVSERIISNLGI